MTEIASIDSARRWRLTAECLALFVGVPVLMVVVSGLVSPISILGALIVVAVVLLSLTPGFEWRELLRRPGPQALPILAGYTAITLACLLATAWVTIPDQMFDFPRQRTELWLMVMALYPIFSVIPQELIFKPLFFRRYGGLFASERGAIVASAAAFALAHLFYLNPVAVIVTFLGGLMMGWAYVRTGSFILVCIMHMIAGQLIFTIGLGVYFYHGAIGR